MTSVPPLPPASSASRRFIAGIVRFGLVVLAIVFVVGYVKHRASPARYSRTLRHVSVQSQSPTAEALGPGDVRIYNADSSVDVVLQGDRLMTGLSPKTVAKVKDEMNKDVDRDSSGAFGVNIGQIVKQSVAGAIGTHVVYQVSDIRDIRYDDGRLRVAWMDGRRDDLFGSTRVNGEKTSNTFSPEEAQRLIDAFHARKAAPINVRPEAPETPQMPEGPQVRDIPPATGRRP